MYITTGARHKNTLEKQRRFDAAAEKDARSGRNLLAQRHPRARAVVDDVFPSLAPLSLE